MKLTLPEDVKKIISELEAHGYEAYAVGGCVRDVILGREPQDYDVTTSAKPEEVKAIFRRTVDTGIEHGTVTVLLEKNSYEVTTYRIDGKYSDSRHPESVTFTPDLREDLLRRDFTINAMAYNDSTGLVDLFGGREDLEGHMIRAVGDPAARFTEDALRIMRCIRFSAQLGFDIEEETLAAAAKLSPTLHLISRERIREELLKLLLSAHPERLSVLYEIGAVADFYPEFVEKVSKNPAFMRETVEKIKKMEKDPVLKLAALLRKAGGNAEESGKIADRFMDALRFDNATRKAVVKLVSFSDESLDTNRRNIRVLANGIGPEYMAQYLKFMEAPETAAVYEDIVTAGECIVQKDMKITGGDLQKLGMKPGKEMGALLRELLELVLEDPEMNDYALLAREAVHRFGKS